VIILVVTRVIGSLIAIVSASIVSFLLLRVAPGDPLHLILGPFATPQAIEALRHHLRLDQSLFEQYRAYVSGLLHGDFGFAYSVGQPVRPLLADRFPATLELGLYASLFAVVGALVLALISTYRRRRAVDAGVQTIAVIGLGVPQFWLGLMLLVVLSEHFDIFPGPDGRLTAPPSLTGLYTVDALLHGQLGTFWDALHHLILPAITLGLAPMAFLTRLLRAHLFEVENEPYLLVAASKGLSPWRAFVRHALPNAVVPTLVASGLIFGQLLAGGVLVESVFRWPGVGALAIDGVQRQDYAVVQAYILLAAVAYVVLNLVVDILVGIIDPRTRQTSSVT
jgi:ABC-type dipeptide/oligopeptide/nickel transport system permease component